MIGTNANIIILTKSKLVVRDIDLFKKFENIEIGISITTLNEKFAKEIEPRASKPLERLEALKKIHNEGLKTYTFISPFFPGITNFKDIIKETIDYTDHYKFENLNFRPHNVPRIFNIIERTNSALIPTYQKFRNNPLNWVPIEEEIKVFCDKNKLEYRIEFHHGGFSKS